MPLTDYAGTEIAVPGSISNLGPSFDALSVAVQLYLRLQVLDVRTSAPDTIEWEFVGAGPTGENLIETAYRLARARLGISAPGLRVRVSSELLGGLTVSCQANGRVIARATRWPDPVRLIVATPDLGLHTAHARQVLPNDISLGDAIFNLQRSLLFVRALESGQYEDLREAMGDRWHQPARTALVPGLAEALALDDPAVLGVCLSGAGPSILALATDGSAKVVTLLSDVYKRLGLPCTIRTLSAHQPL